MRVADTGVSGELTSTGLQAGGICVALGVRAWGKEYCPSLGGQLRGVTPPASAGRFFLISGPVGSRLLGSRGLRAPWGWLVQGGALRAHLNPVSRTSPPPLAARPSLSTRKGDIGAAVSLLNLHTIYL
jgi:hypothetical protein